MPADVPTTGPNLRSPDERPPIEPVLATQHTAAGAKAFAEFFIRTIDWAYATNSTKYMRHYYESNCVACASAADAVDGAARKGHHFIGDRFTISRSVTGPTRGAQPSVIVHFNITAAEVVDQHEKPVNAAPAQTDYQEHIYLAWRRSGWTVVEMIPKAP